MAQQLCLQSHPFTTLDYEPLTLTRCVRIETNKK